MDGSPITAGNRSFPLFQSLGALVILAGAAYIFDPTVQQPDEIPGQILTATLLEHSKTGFEQVASVQLISGAIVQVNVVSTPYKAVSAGDAVIVSESVSLLFHRHTFVARPIR